MEHNHNHQDRRIQFIKKLYEISGNSHKTVVHISDITSSLGYTDEDFDEIRAIVDYIEAEGWLKVSHRLKGAFPIWLSITHEGIVIAEKKVELSLQQSRNQKTILFLGANPKNTTRLRVDEEFRKIDEKLQASKFRNNFKLISKWAVNIETLIKSMLDNEPQIIHFSGHGNLQGIFLEQDDGTIHVVPQEALQKLFSLFRGKVECILLNACYSMEQAKIISHNDMLVIGMSDKINDKAAIDFSVGFYQSVGAGKSYQFAYQIGKTVLISQDISQVDMPTIWKNGKELNLD